MATEVEQNLWSGHMVDILHNNQKIMKNKMKTYLLINLLFLLTLFLCFSFAHFSESTITRTYFVDGMSQSYPNVTCKDETNPCNNPDQAITAAILEFNNSTSSLLNNFTMIIKISQYSNCGTKAFDFSKYALNFNLVLIGNPTFYICQTLFKNSLIDELYIEGVSLLFSLDSSSRIGKVSINKSENSYLIIISSVNNLKISNTEIIITTKNVENVEIVNSKITGLNIEYSKKLEISDYTLQGSTLMNNFKVFSIRNSIWKGDLSKFISGESVNIFNTTTITPAVFISISNIYFQEIHVMNGNFDFLYQIINVEKVTIVTSTFYNNTIAPTKSLMIFEYLSRLYVDDCDFSFNKGGFLSIFSTHRNSLESEYKLSSSTYYNNQLKGNALLKTTGNNLGYRFQAISLIFINNSNEDSTSCLEIIDGQTSIVESTFKNNSAITGGAVHLTNVYLLIQSTIFMNNSAVDSGGAIYFKSTTADNLSVEEVKCEGNHANNYGGCLYFNLPFGVEYSKLFQFSNNFAGSLGNNVGYPVDEIMVKDSNGNLLNDRLKLLPGKSISFRLYISDRLNQSANFLPSDQLDIALYEMNEKSVTIYDSKTQSYASLLNKKFEKSNFSSFKKLHYFSTMLYSAVFNVVCSHDENSPPPHPIRS